MGGFLEADTGRLLDIADRLDPAPARAALTAARAARELAPTCGEPLPGCQAFGRAVSGAADRVAAFCAEAERGVSAYASVAREAAGLYEVANDNGAAGFRAVTDGTR